MQSLVEKAPIEEDLRVKVGFLTQAMVDAALPHEQFPHQPRAMRRAVETGGRSVIKGAQNFLDDVANNDGQPKQFADGVYEVGKNMAITPGKVVYRNELMELLQYSPTTGTVHEIPLLFSPPWINKYYVMDLAPGRSLVQWAVDHGHTVFLISYRNPDESMRSVGMDDYLLSGPITALDVIRDITGQEKVNLLGLCLGGTLSMITLAYLDALGQDRINSATFLNTLTDFSVPGALGVFTDESTVAKLEESMAKTGFLPADNMAKTFNMMRGNDLIWNYVVNNWLKGEDPPAFDLLTWNADSTRMPATMHSFYLRSCYLENQLARGVMEIAGEMLNIKSVDQDLYFLAAEQDHIAPWRSSYKGATLPTGNVRFVLSNSGHIAGIVNPPNPKSKHWVNDVAELPENPDEWFAGATMNPTTWWEDWATWIDSRAGKQIDPPPLGSGSTHRWAMPPAPTSSAPDPSFSVPLHHLSHITTSAVTITHVRGLTMSEFSVSKAVITGGAQGIGFSIAHRLSTEGLTVSVLDINEGGAKDAAEKISADTGNPAFGFACNVADRAQVHSVFTQAAEAMGGLDTYIGNAGITRDKMFHKLTDADWDQSSPST